MRRRARVLLLALVALCPAAWKPPLYRWFFGYRIGSRARIGVSLIDAAAVDIGDDVVIGHGNVVWRVGSLSIGEHARIGHLNVIRGGAEVRLGSYVDVLRRNELNSIPEPVVVNPVDPRLLVGPGAVIAAGHKIDFTDRVEIGRRAILGGRNSSLWTHNRQRTAPVTIGEQAYLGSEMRAAPGAAVPPRSIVGMGAVVVDELTEEGVLYAGVPARRVKVLSAHDRYLIERPTRDDLPDGL